MDSADRAAGATPALDVEPLGGGRFRITSDGRQRTAYAAGPPHARWVFVEGRVYVIDTTAERGAAAAPRDDELTLAPPMPATVTAISVQEGDRVAEGDVLVALEAMKMELPIRAPRAGRVRAVTCRVGDLVQPGTPVVELDEPSDEPSNDPS